LSAWTLTKRYRVHGGAMEWSGQTVHCTVGYSDFNNLIGFTSK
jgi:hypothetical protein